MKVICRSPKVLMKLNRELARYIEPLFFNKYTSPPGKLFDNRLLIMYYIARASSFRHGCYEVHLVIISPRRFIYKSGYVYTDQFSKVQIGSDLNSRYLKLSKYDIRNLKE